MIVESYVPDPAGQLQRSYPLHALAVGILILALSVHLI